MSFSYLIQSELVLGTRMRGSNSVHSLLGSQRPLWGQAVACKNEKKNVVFFFVPFYQGLTSGSEKAMAPHSSTLAWKIPWMEEPGRLHGIVKSRTRLSDFTFTFHFHALEKEMATHSSVLAWRIPGTGEPGGLPSMRSHRVRHD